MPFSYSQKILFKHCDPAGIVFYPRYFEMLNDVVEAFFDEVVGVPFEKLLETSGVPTVNIECTYHAPGRHGDLLDIQVLCSKVGRTSLGLKYFARCGEVKIFTASSTLVHVDSNGQSQAWPDSIREVLLQQVVAEENQSPQV